MRKRVKMRIHRENDKKVEKDEEREKNEKRKKKKKI